MFRSIQFRTVSNQINMSLSQEYKKLAAEVRYFYFKNAAVSVKTLRQYIDLMSDVTYAYGVDKAAKRHAAKTTAKTFYYR